MSDQQPEESIYTDEQMKLLEKQMRTSPTREQNMLMQEHMFRRMMLERDPNYVPAKRPTDQESLEKATKEPLRDIMRRLERAPKRPMGSESDLSYIQGQCMQKIRQLQYDKGHVYHKCNRWQQLELDSEGMGSFYCDLPIKADNDLGFLGQKPESFLLYESACRDGSLSTVKSIISGGTYRPVFLHHGLTIDLRSGDIELADYFLSIGALARKTALKISFWRHQSSTFPYLN
ncbi:hypothetical protein N7495_005176 [Penicillium taxi]|uniref:uncharacterized protein n=1 Tax=Penicillium taxi TaxID=168475 RepID=UPI0025458ED2|nr:uncharacterized protein N7495_005176 [Penicillium taxi]KAJ5893485.1 hypothetical protein N7495_005176 [Penicillium taxi]